MAMEWKGAGVDGWEIEEVDRPRTIADRCARCGKASRLVERERVKNLGLFGVAIVATERGGRVFVCPLCGAVFEPPAGAPSGADADADVIDRLTTLHEQLERAEDDVALWTPRIAVAARSGDTALATEAHDMVQRRSRAAALLRAEIEPLQRSLRRGRAGEDTAQAPAGRLSRTVRAVATEGTAVEVERPERSVEDDLAALRAKLAVKPVVTPKEDDLAALKRKLGLLPAEAAVEVPVAKVELPEDDEDAALKRKLARPATPSVEAPSEGDDAQLAALKERLRPKRG